MRFFRRKTSLPAVAPVQSVIPSWDTWDLSAEPIGWEQELAPELARHPRVTIQDEPYEGIDTSLNFRVQAAHYTDTHPRSRSELARIVASHSGWRLAHSDELVDDDLRLVAPSIEKAAVAMNKLGWFVRYDSGPGSLTGIAWSEVPNRSTARADQVREQLGIDFPG